MTYDEETYAVRHERRSERLRKRKAVWTGVCAGVVIAGVVSYMTFGRYVSLYSSANGDLPLIKAETGAFGMRPETPGGMDVPNQDKLIYERLRENDDVRVEKLLPAPEKPYFPPEEEIVEKSADETSSDQAAKNEKENDETPTSLEVASTTMIDENGERVEVMFRTIPETQAQGQVEKVRAENEEKKQAKQEKNTEVSKSSKEKETVKKEEKTVLKERFAVQLVSTKSKESSESEWKRLSKKHAEILKDLPHSISEIKTSSAVFFRLRAGDFETREKAAPVCEKLKAKKQECLVVKQ